jgi:hypothetical protein
MVFVATARWNFRGETWFSVEIEAVNLDVAGALFYSMLPSTFFRGNHRLVAIKPQDCGPFSPRILAAAKTSSAGQPMQPIPGVWCGPRAEATIRAQPEFKAQGSDE